MDHLRQGIGLRGYGQKDPKQEYKKEGYNGFIQMLGAISAQFVSQLMRVQAKAATAEEAARLQRQMAQRQRQMQEGRADAEGKLAEPAPASGHPPAGGRPGRRSQGGPERSVPLRQWQEVQEVPRRRRGQRLGLHG